MADNIAERLEAAIRAVVPSITGVSLGSVSDKATWTVQPSSLQEQAQPIIDAYTEPTPNTLFDQHAEQRIGEKALMATALALWECIPAPTMTKPQLRARAKAIFKTL